MANLTRRKSFVDLIYEDFFNSLNSGFSDNMFSTSLTGGYDIEERENEFLLSVDLPGYAKSDINVDVQDGILRIAAVREKESQQEEGRYRHYGRYYGEFKKSFQLPQSVNDENVEAHYENGVLHVMIPKKPEANGRKIEIQEGKSSFWERLVPKKSEKAENVKTLN